uniref:Fibrinogen C-terminal domain-containing protein n=1 Tax=Amphimedon queenslandica TaxID=400682 RepID=A0A1X7UQW7_AMPQE
MYSYYSILLVLCMTSYSLSASSTLDGTCVNPTTLSFIENSLTNISDQLKGSSCSSDGATSEGLTGLLQLALVKELAKDYKDESCDKEERKLLKNINASIANKIDASTAATDARLNAIEPQLASLQSQVSSLSSDLNKLSRLLAKHVNVSLDDEEEAPSSPLLSSCDAILSKWPNSPSGYYNLADVNGHSRHVYCHMETLCGKGGGWRRIASLNMTDPNEKCPTQFRTYSENGVLACGRPVTNSGSCVGITFPSRDIKYSQVCGKVIGYQDQSTNGAAAHYANTDINSAYIDGISLTHGNPRKHIWSLISGYSGIAFSGCPCGSNNPKSVPSFVGSHYYCEAGCHNNWGSCNTLYPSDPLWDGKGCGSTETTCCQRTLIPWFYRSFGYSTTDNIEMRLCCDEGTNNEDVAIREYEIYVK